MPPKSTKNTTGTVTIQPRNVFGIRSDVKGNIQFTPKQEVIYPVAGVLSIHDYKTNTQKFLRFTENSKPEVIVMSPNKKLLAVAESLLNVCSINIYNLGTLKKQKTLHFPPEIPTPEAECMCFTYDTRGIAVLSKEPDAFLVIFYFDKTGAIVVGRVSNSSQTALSAKYISCSLSDNGLVAVGGDFTFKQMSRQEKSFSLIGSITGEGRIVTSLVWLTTEFLLVGTAKNEIFFIEGTDPKAIYDASNTNVIDLSKTDGLPPVEQPPDRIDVNCLTAFQKGFAYSIHNVLHVFEKESTYRFAKKTQIVIPMTPYPRHTYRITNIAINIQMDTVIVTTRHSQIYISMLIVPETLMIKHLEFKTLGEPLHIDRIDGMSCCAWKPIIITASRDQTIRIWNYETGHVELVKKYQVNVTTVCLHPSGVLVAVGFNDQMRLMEILLDDLKVTKTFNFPKSTDMDFSSYGHLLACAYENVVVIVSVFTFDIVQTIKGHNGIVRSIRFNESAEYIVSCGDDGAVYQWHITTGRRTNEFVQKGIEYREVAVAKNISASYMVTNTGLLREMINSDITRDIKMPTIDGISTNSGSSPLTSMSLARSDLVMFVATEYGQLYNVQIPFLDAGGGTCTNYRFFDKEITKIQITYNDMLLATASADGTLVFWSILNNEGRVAPMDLQLGNCVDIMIPRQDLLDKYAQINSLELRILQQIEEFKYQMRQGAESHSEAMRDIQQGFIDQIELLKREKFNMEYEHEEQLNLLNNKISKQKETHAAALMDLEKEFHQKILIEFEKTATIKQQMNDMRDDYEIKLRKSAGCLQDTIEALETDFRKQLQERQELIRQLMKEMDSKKVEFVEYCNQVQLDNDRKMVETQFNYEKRLKNENDEMLKWRADAGVLDKKLASVTINCDELEKEKDVLLAEHYKTLAVIRNLQKDIGELKREIEERDTTIREKEKRVNELQKKNQELEKYKQVLNHKIVELKAQIEPRERDIKEKKDQIIEMEKELESLEMHNQQAELQINELKDKYFSTEKDLKIERTRLLASRGQVSRICSDIYRVSGFIQEPIELKNEVMKLYHRYSDDKSLKKSLEADAEVENEFLRQRDHLENIIEQFQQKEKRKIDVSSGSGKLLKENVKLLAELNQLRQELKELQSKNYNMESILGISGKFLPTAVAREKLAKACANFDDIESKYKQEIGKLTETIRKLVDENQTFRSQVVNKHELMVMDNGDADNDDEDIEKEFPTWQ